MRWGTSKNIYPLNMDFPAEPVGDWDGDSPYSFKDLFARVYQTYYPSVNNKLIQGLPKTHKRYQKNAFICLPSYVQEINQAEGLDRSEVGQTKHDTWISNETVKSICLTQNIYPPGLRKSILVFLSHCKKTQNVDCKHLAVLWEEKDILSRAGEVGSPIMKSFQSGRGTLKKYIHWIQISQQNSFDGDSLYSFKRLFIQHN